ncbi:hypothetical protein SAMN04488564_111193 [Lentzea waywayandensis]|uniref:Glyoxalase-like domain-containing protein n=1 Tax=Lentzea waywayandensis TaxID=84724 RepID=A0A1I6FCU9_9PSEU|nr:hypothetical protein SAMN04488564_111193 [Lentzea waywayandensis]
MRLDVMVTDPAESEPHVPALGAALLEGAPKSIGFRVCTGPAGHPFCLVTD